MSTSGTKPAAIPTCGGLGVKRSGKARPPQAAENATNAHMAASVREIR